MGQLCKEHAHNVTPWTESSRHGIHTCLARKFTDQMGRNQIAKLPKNAEFGSGWFAVSFYHLCRVTELKNHSNHFFLCSNRHAYGMAVRGLRVIKFPFRVVCMVFKFITFSSRAGVRRRSMRPSS